MMRSPKIGPVTALSILLMVWLSGVITATSTQAHASPAARPSHVTHATGKHKAPPAKKTNASGGLDSGPRAADTPVDPALASTGKGLFNKKSCNACHNMDARVVGPALSPVPKQRSAAWILAMIQRPAEMTKSDPIAMQLFKEYKTQMAVPVSVNAAEAKALLEYIKSGGK